MHFGFIHLTGNHLHGFSTGSILSDISQITPAAHHHPVPAKQHFLREWLSKGAAQINHHLSDSSLRRSNTSLVGSQSQLLAEDRKSTRLNSSHLVISYAVFCLKKKQMAQKISMPIESNV